MERDKKNSLIAIVIKVVIAVILTLTVIWAIVYYNKKLDDSLNVLLDDIFSENMNSMKEVGKEYFTTERLPQKIGDVRTLTLEEMYANNLILELTDKDGNACSAENSYVAIEKYSNEYQMKVYLECGEESDYIVVIMGCYDYCDTAICELESSKVDNGKGNNSGNKFVEYEYMKTTGGSWSDWSDWSEWSKSSIVSTNYREVETKKVNEEYTYDKTITDTLYAEFDVSCPSGYTMSSDGTSCYKEEKNTIYASPVCPNISGYTNTGRNDFECTYSKATTVTADPVCPTISGWKNTGRNGFTCSYSKTTTVTADPVCPSKSGWTNTERNGFTCSYSRTVTGSSYSLSYSHTATGYYVPADTSEYKYEQISADYVYDCNNSCAFRWVYTYKVYKKVYDTITETATENAVCPSGYNSVNGTCTSSSTSTKTETAVCPSGYNNVNGTCTSSSTSTKIETALCPSGYNNVNGTCMKTTTSTKTELANCPEGFDNVKWSCVNTITNTKTENATCPKGYSKMSDENKCSKIDTNYIYKSIVKTCPKEYSKTSDGSKCYKKVLITQTITQVREVTYYRYRIREYIGGSIDYKWSTSKEDKELLNNGYVLTGRTREGGK